MSSSGSESADAIADSRSSNITVKVRGQTKLEDFDHKKLAEEIEDLLNGDR